MRIVIIAFVSTLFLAACVPSMGGFETELWAKGAESNAATDCSSKTCFGY